MSSSEEMSLLRSVELIRKPGVHLQAKKSFNSKEFSRKRRVQSRAKSSIQSKEFAGRKEFLQKKLVRYEE
jgi:hypothetical protein